MRLSNAFDIGSVGLPIGEIRQKVWDYFGEKHFFVHHEDELVRAYEYFIVTFASMDGDHKTTDTILHYVHRLMQDASEKCSCIDELRDYFGVFDIKIAQVQQQEMMHVITQVRREAMHHIFFHDEFMYISQ